MKIASVLFTGNVPMPGTSVNGEYHDRIIAGAKYDLEQADGGVWGILKAGPLGEANPRFYSFAVIKTTGGGDYKFAASAKK